MDDDIVPLSCTKTFEFSRRKGTLKPKRGALTIQKYVSYDFHYRGRAPHTKCKEKGEQASFSLTYFGF